jgi:hypothetical protein
MNTPVVLLIFKRPDTTEKVFEVIRQAKPAKLLVVADGARDDRPTEAEKCSATRAIIDKVDWDCEVFKNYSDVNLGCKQRVYTGLNWAFEMVEEAIILEDDCLPHPTFFQFCEELLQNYRDDERIMSIGGTNIKGNWKSDIQSYHFSYYGSIWGWATWRRAWQHFDIAMKLWEQPEVKHRVRDVLADEQQYQLREKHFDAACSGKVDAWSYQWRFATLIQSGLAILPAVNLVSNIGFGEGATHTQASNSQERSFPLQACSFPLKINDFVAVDRAYDREIFMNLTRRKNVFLRAANKMKKLTAS